MSLPYQDSFAGGAAVLPNPPWTQGALTAITLNRDGSSHAKASAVSSVNDTMAWDNANTYSPNQYAQAQVVNGLSSGLNYAEVNVRSSGNSPSTFSCFSFFTDGITGTTHTAIEKWVNGVATEILAIATTFANGDVMRLEIFGTRLRAYKNGVLVGTVTDASLASGAAGLGVYNSATNTVLMTAFEGGNLPSLGKPQVVQGRKRRIRKSRATLVAGATRQQNVVTRIVRGRQIVVLRKKKRPDRKGKTTQIKRARLAAQPAPKRPPKVLTVVLKKKLRPDRKGKTTIIKRARLAAQPAPKRPPKVQVVVLKKKRRPERKAKTTIVQRARLAFTPQASRPSKTATIVLRPKRRVRQGVTKLIAAIISTPPIFVKPAISLIEGRRRRKRTGFNTILKGAPRAVVAPPAARKKVATVVLARKRRRRVGSVEIIKSGIFSKPPRKLATIVLAKKRRRRAGSADVIKAPAASVIRPRKTLIVVAVKKRKIRKTVVQELRAKKSVTPVSGAPRAPMTVSLKKRHRKLQGKTTIVRAKKQGNQPIIPPRPPKVVTGRRRRRRTGDVIQITGARRAPPPAVRPVKTLFQVLPKKRRKKRTASTTRVTGARRAPPVAPRQKPLIVRRPKARKQLSRKKTLILLRAWSSNPVVQFSAVITSYSGASIVVSSKSGTAYTVTALSDSREEQYIIVSQSGPAIIVTKLSDSQIKIQVIK